MAAGELHRRAPISSAQDEIDAVACAVNVLVSELHFTLERLGRAERDAHQANEQKSLFLRNVSHELRTPLAAILSHTALLARTSLDEKQAQAVERIRANGDALLHLIEDLLDLTRIEAGTLHLSLEPVSVSEVAADVVQSLLPLARTKGLTLMLSMPPDLPAAIVTDGRRLRQILMNLVANAVKFTDKGEVVVSLRVKNGDTFAIDVTDTGIGMSDADQQRLFSAFVRPDNARGGAGLGLVLARQLSRHLGGDLTLVSSQVNQGSRFRLELAIPKSEKPSAAPASVTPAIDLDGLSVLLAEDNVDILDCYTTWLELVGCRVATVTNGAEAVSRVLSDRFDVVLMDIQMPILDGLEATRQLRQQGFNGPILALSARAMQEDRTRFLEAGCNDHIAKPVDLDRLLVRLAEYRSSK
jgi:signal transduction histidine kinase